MISKRMAFMLRQCHKNRPQTCHSVPTVLPYSYDRSQAVFAFTLSQRPFATTFKPENPSDLQSHLQKPQIKRNAKDVATLEKKPRNSKEQVDDLLPQNRKAKSDAPIEDQKKSSPAEKIISDHYFDGSRIQTKQQFSKYVTSHEHPVVVLYTKQGDVQSQLVEATLKSELLKSKGMFRLCVLDKDSITEKLREELLKMPQSQTPSFYLIYRGSIVQEEIGEPTPEELQNFMKTIKSFHYLANEEIIVNKLLRKGQELLEQSKWKDLIQVCEDIEKMKRWNEIYGLQIYSMMSLAYATIGDLTKAKHYLNLYTDYQTEIGQELEQDDEESQRINRASQIIMSHISVGQQRQFKCKNHDQFETNQTENQSHFTETEAAEILLSDHKFNDWIIEEENTSSSEFDEVSTEILNERIKLAEQLIENFSYEEGLDLCLSTLDVDYNHVEAHRVLLETFNALGFRNEVTLKTKEALKAIMLKSKF